MFKSRSEIDHYEVYLCFIDKDIEAKTLINTTVKEGAMRVYNDYKRTSPDEDYVEVVEFTNHWKYAEQQIPSVITNTIDTKFL